MRTILIFVLISFHANADPKIFAHRGGQAQFPENTLYAFEQALKSGAQGLELDVQLTKDNIVVLFHPDDLAAKTNGKGSVANTIYDDLKKLDAAYHFDPEGNKKFPLRGKGHSMPTLDLILEKFPATEILIDMKSVPAEPLVTALVKVVDARKAWNHVLFYSTDKTHLEVLLKLKPEARLFENRDLTRTRLLTLRNQSLCIDQPEANKFVGFELDREMQVEETFKLGKGISKVHFRLWDENAIQCHKDAGKIVIFGINDKNAYALAQKLKVYGVLSDNPGALR